MTVPPAIARRIAEIAADRVHGASFLAREALVVMAATAMESHAADPAALQEELAAVADALMAARPDMAPVRNWLTLLLQRFRATAVPDVATLRQRAIDEAMHLRQQSEAAAGLVADRAAVLLPAGALVATASFSQTVVEAIAAAHRIGKNPRALAAQSIVDGVGYGMQVAAALAAVGVPAEVVADDALESMSRATLGLIGADTVFVDGGVVNGTPSRRLAEILAAARKPLIVVCEAAKIARSRPSERAPRLAPGFDLVPPALIASIVTEVGVFTPPEIASAPFPK